MTDLIEDPDNGPAEPEAPKRVIPIPTTIDEVVDQYVRLRDTIKKADDEHKKKVAPAKEYMDALEGALIEKLKAIGADSVKTPHGTAYRSTKRSASIKDGDAFRKWVIGHNDYDLVDWRANANAVDDFIKSHGSTPPGVDFSTTITVGVRRK